MTDKDKAVQEAECVAAADEYFKARAWLMDTNDNRRIFEAGFDRAYALLSKLRAEGVQAGDERAAFEAAYAKRLRDKGTPPTFAAFMTASDGSYVLPIVDTAWDMWKDARAALASAPVAGEAQEEIERMAVNRYRPVPDGKFSYKVVAGDGTRSLYTGTKDSCLRVAAKLTEAFLDGAFVAASAAPQASEAVAELPAPVNGEAFQGDNVAERLDNMADGQPPGSQAQSDLYAAATIWRKHIAHRAAPQASEAVRDAEDAARWRAFIGCARIRPLGSAGLEQPDPNHYAHMGLEIWTVYGRDYSPELLKKMDDENERGRRWLVMFADVARAALSAQPGAQNDEA